MDIALSAADVAVNSEDDGTEETVKLINCFKAAKRRTSTGNRAVFGAHIPDEVTK